MRRRLHLLACLCALSGNVGAALTDGLATYYDFEAGLEDQSGHARHMTVATGTPEPAWAGGTVIRGAATVDRNTLLAGNALNLVDDDNDVLKAPLGSGPSATTAGTYNLGGHFTLSAWHLLAPLPNNTSTRYFVFEGEDNFDVSWGVSSGDTYVAYVAQVTAGSSVLPRLEWHHVVHVFNTSGNEMTINLYVDGQFVDSMSAPARDMDFDRIVFGDARDLAGDREWDGLLDEVAIWDRALSASEIREVHARGIAGLGVTTDPASIGKAFLALSASPVGGGMVSPSFGLVNTGAVIAVQAAPSPGWSFNGWMGGFAGQPAAFPHTMAASVDAVATFVPDDSDADLDGLSAYDEIVRHGTNPGLADSDADGLPDGVELFTTHTRPLAADTALLAELDNAFSPATAGRLALTPAGIAMPGSSPRIEIGFQHSPDGLVWSALDLTNAVLEPMAPPGRLRLRVPAPSPAAAVWLVRPAPTPDPH